MSIVAHDSTDRPAYLPISPRLQLVQHALGLARLGTLQVRSGTLVDPEVVVEVEVEVEVVVVVVVVGGGGSGGTIVRACSAASAAWARLGAPS